MKIIKDDIRLKRLSLSRSIDQIVVATTSSDEDIKLKNYIEVLGYSCEIGSTNNVLDRYFKVASQYEADIVVRITGDCPIADPNLVGPCGIELAFDVVPRTGIRVVGIGRGFVGSALQCFDSL